MNKYHLLIGTYCGEEEKVRELLLRTCVTTYIYGVWLGVEEGQIPNPR